MTKTTAERQREWREKRKAQGYEMHTVWLDPDVAKKLNERLRNSEKKQSDRQQLINQTLRENL